MKEEQKTNHLFVSSLLGAFLSGFIPMAHAASGDKSVAHAKFKEGLRFAEKEDYAMAVSLFAESIKIYPTKSGLFNLANAYNMNNQFVEALETFSRLDSEYARTMKQEMKRAVEKSIAEMEEMVARLKVVVDNPKASIAIDGKQHTLERDGVVLLNPGVYAVTVSLEGYETIHRSVTVASGADKIERFSLTAVVTDVDPELASKSVVEGSDSDADLSEEHYLDGSPSGKKRSIPFWTGVGFTAVSGIGTAVFLSIAQIKANDFYKYDDDLKNGNFYLSEKAHLESQRDAAQADARRYSFLGLGFGVATGVFAVSTTIVFLVRYGKGDFSESVRIEVNPNGITGRF